MNETIESKNKMTMSRFTELMHNLSGAIMLFGQTLISAFFVVIILCLVLFVEIQRVAHGIQLFEQSPKSAYTGAFVLVMMLLTLEFVIHYIESKSDYHQERKSDFSLRHFGQWFLYFIGYQDKDKGITWQARLKSPAQAIKSYSRLLTMTILALALGGSMSDALANVSGNWMQGLQTILLESSLLEIVEWSGGLLFALALVVGAQRLTAYVAQRASETLLSNDNQGDIEIQADYEKEKRDYSEDEHVDREINIFTLDDTSEALPFDGVEFHEEHTASCEFCSWTKNGYDSEVNARRGLSMHQRSCELYQGAKDYAFDSPEWGNSNEIEVQS